MYVCVGGYICLPHMTQTAHSIFSDILVRVVEVQKLQSISGTQFGPDLKQCLELRRTNTHERSETDIQMFHRSYIKNNTQSLRSSVNHVYCKKYY